MRWKKTTNTQDGIVPHTRCTMYTAFFGIAFSQSQPKIEKNGRANDSSVRHAYDTIRVNLCKTKQIVRIKYLSISDNQFDIMHTYSTNVWTTRAKSAQSQEAYELRHHVISHFLFKSLSFWISRTLDASHGNECALLTGLLIMMMTSYATGDDTIHNNNNAIRCSTYTWIKTIRKKSPIWMCRSISIRAFETHKEHFFLLIHTIVRSFNFFFPSLFLLHIHWLPSQREYSLFATGAYWIMSMFFDMW